MMRILLFSAAVVVLVGLATSVTNASDNIPPVFVTPGSYVSKNLDGTHPYGQTHGIEIGVDVAFSHYEDCLEVYVTTTWTRPLGGGPKTYNDEEGQITYDLCEEPPVAVLHSASRPGLTGDLLANDDGTYTADYSANGGNTRVWHPE